MNTLKQFSQYLFSSVPGEFKLYVPIAILISLLFISSILFHYVYKKHRKDDPAFRRLFKKTASHLCIFAILFTIYALIRYENIPYFSMRIWLLLSLLLLAYFIYKVVKTYFTKYRVEKLNAHHAAINTKTKEVKTFALWM